MALQLQGGNLDLVRTPAVDDFIQLKDDPRFQGLTHPNPGTILEIGMNAGHPPFDDKRVRQAMNYAMNRARYAETAFKGTAQPLSLPWMPSAPAYDAARSTYFAHDLDRAQALLKEAAVSGFATDIIISNAQPALNIFAQILQTDLASIGVTLNIKNVDQAVWADLLVNKKPEYTGFWGGNDSLTNEHPAGIFTSPGWRTVNNHSNFQSDDWNQIVSTVSSETDPTKQKAAFTSMNDYLLDQCFTLAATTNPITFLASAKVRGVGYLMHLGGLSLTDAWLDA
jgi:ABC-type transport system substrate-binding protein